MKYFRDSECKEELKAINFGIVNAGTTKELTVYAKNDTRALVTNLVVEAVGMEVISAPKELIPSASDKIVLKWTPSIAERIGMSSKLSVKYDEIYK